MATHTPVSVLSPAGRLLQLSFVWMGARNDIFPVTLENRSFTTCLNVVGDHMLWLWTRKGLKGEPK